MLLPQKYYHVIREFSIHLERVKNERRSYGGRGTKDTGDYVIFLDHLKDLGLFYMRVAVRASEEAEQWKRTQQ